MCHVKQIYCYQVTCKIYTSVKLSKVIIYKTYGLYICYKKCWVLPFEMLRLVLNMPERERNQHGLKRRKRSCVSFMRSTVILKVCFHFVCCLLYYMLQDAYAHYVLCLHSFIDCWFLCLVPDIVETLLPLLSDSTRSRRQVVTQLVRMGLVDNAKELKKQKYVLQTWVIY